MHSDPDKERDFTALGQRVLAVASASKKVGDWAAYIDAVSGEDHRKEWEQVLAYGTKLPYEVAKVLFPDYDARYTWRY